MRGLHVLHAGIGQHAERVALVQGHELIALGVVGRVQRHGQVDRLGLCRQLLDAGNHPDGRDREAARAEAEGAVEPPNGLHHPVIVRHGLAHAHEDHVGQTPRLCFPSRPHHLLDDLPGGELSAEPTLARGAEAARHGAPGLARDAHRHSVSVDHQDGLDHRPIGQGEGPLHRLAVVGHALGGHRQGARELGGEPMAQTLGEIGHLLEGAEPTVKGIEDLPRAIGGLVAEQRRETVEVEVIGRGHTSKLRDRRSGGPEVAFRS